MNLTGPASLVLYKRDCADNNFAEPLTKHLTTKWSVIHFDKL
jgi:hypothetical protein